MKRIPYAACLVLLVVALPFTPLRAQGRSDFSGTWTMDPSQSESAAQSVAIGPVSTVIKQTASDITIETSRDGDNRVVTYKLDGSDTVTPTVTARMRWNGPKLVTETTYLVTEGWIMTFVLTRSLNASASEMTVDTTVNVQHGYTGTTAVTDTQHYRPVRDVFTRTP